MACRGEKRVKFQDEDDEADEDDSGEAEDIHYKDFFDPAEGIPESQDLPEASGIVLHPTCRRQQRDSSCTASADKDAERPDDTRQGIGSMM